METSKIIELHMARAFFASAWADCIEENGGASRFSGREIMGMMPGEIDPAAIHAARILRFDMERTNGKPIATILAHAIEAHDGDRPADAEHFGHYCAMQAMGHGVGLLDAFGQAVYESVRVPYVEFGSHSLERDYE